jgi:hypothetical protein
MIRKIPLGSCHPQEVGGVLYFCLRNFDPELGFKIKNPLDRICRPANIRREEGRTITMHFPLKPFA